MFLLGATYAQEKNYNDSILIAAQLIEKGNLREADKILSSFIGNNPENVMALWMHAQVLFNRNKITQAQSKYLQALAIWPGINDLSIDYVRFLQQSGYIRQSIDEIDKLLALDSKNTSLHLLLARNFLWQGKTKQAKDEINFLLDSDSNNEDAIQLLKELNLIAAPYFGLTLSYSSDNQPLGSLATTIETGKLYSPAFSPKVFLQHYYIHSDEQAYSQFGGYFSNALRANSLGMKLTPGIGYFRNNHANGSDNNITYGLSIEQPLFKQLSINIAAGKSPYMSNLSILEESVFNHFATVILKWNRPKKLLFEMGHKTDFFEDDNYINAEYMWGLVPVLKTQNMLFQLGYGFSYSQAKNTRYIPVNTMTVILSDTVTNKYPEGKFYPYFTPNQQQIHSAILKLEYNPNKKVGLQMLTSFGFYAISQYPTLKLEKNEKDGSYEVNRSFIKNRYFPLDFAAGVHHSINDNVTLAARYAYSQNNFYSHNRFSLNLLIRVPNE